MAYNQISNSSVVAEGAANTAKNSISVQSLFERHAYADSVAVSFGKESLTYCQVEQRANRIARKLRNLGAERGKAVAICAERTLDLPIAILAILKTGAAYLPLDPTYPAERLAFMLSDSKADLLVTQSSLLPLLPSPPAAVYLLDQTNREERGESIENSSEAGDLAYLIYTSGSTGKPKGIMMPHGPLYNLITWQRNVLPNATRTLQLAPISFDVSFQELFSTWDTGGTLVIVPESLRRDPLRLWQFIVDERIERLFLPFVGLQQLAEVATGPANLREVITAGEQLRVTPQIRRFFSNLQGCKLHNHYGPSETHVVTAYTLEGDPGSWPALPAIGRPIANTEIYLLDEIGNLGDNGELCAAGDCLCKGYLNRPDLTAERFVVLGNGERVYKTGDSARRMSDGNLEYLGRLDGQAKVRGYRVEPGETEAVLSDFPAVRAVAVIIKADAQGENRLIGYVVGEPNLSIDALREFARQKLPDYLVPSLIIPLPALPLTPSGKVDRRALPAPETLSKSRVSLSDLENNIAQVWGETLGHQNFGPEENFFDVGGDSLRLTRVHTRLREHIRSDLEIASLFEHTTVRALASYLAAASPNNFSKNIQDRAALQRAALAARTRLKK
jgi:amino acid adenylation domain-containing protein